MQIPIQISIKGTAILGMFHVPEKHVKGSPVLLMCYGFNGNRVEQHRMSVLAGREAEKNGIYLVRFDYRGQGVSDGEFSNVILQDRIEDILEISKFIDGCFQGEKHSLIPIGFSDGARLVASAVEQLERVSALCMWSPIFFQNKDFFEGKTTSRLQREPKTKKFVYSVYGLWVNSDYLRDMNAHSSFDAFCNADYPKLCMFGGEDHLVRATIEQINNSQKDAKMNNNVEMMFVDNAKHVYSRSEWADEVIQKTMQWVIGINEE